MKITTQLKLIGSGIGIMLGISALYVWLSGHYTSLSEANMVFSRPVEAPTATTYKDIQAFMEKIDRLIADRNELEQQVVQLNHILAILQTQFADISQNQATLAQQVSQLSRLSSTTTSTAMPEEEVATPTLGPEQAVEEIESQERAYLASVEETFRAEQIDPRWAPSAKLAVDEIFQTGTIQGLSLQGLDLTSVECRMTMCKLELARSSLASSEQDSFDLIHFIPWQGPVFFQVDSHAGKAVVYLAKEGHQLP